jgi:phosphorylcholine metabolism protein LicD
MEIFNRDKLFDFVSFGGETAPSLEEQEKWRNAYEHLAAEAKEKELDKSAEAFEANLDIKINPDDLLVKDSRTVSQVLKEDREKELPDVCPSCGKRHFQVLSSTPINDDFLVFNDEHWEKYTPETRQYRVKCLECGAIYDLVI